MGKTSGLVSGLVNSKSTKWEQGFKEHKPRAEICPKKAAFAHLRPACCPFHTLLRLRIRIRASSRSDGGDSPSQRVSQCQASKQQEMILFILPRKTRAPKKVQLFFRNDLLANAVLLGFPGKGAREGQAIRLLRCSLLPGCHSTGLFNGDSLCGSSLSP